MITRTLMPKTALERMEARAQTTQAQNAIKAFVLEKEKRRFRTLDEQALTSIESAREITRDAEAEREAKKRVAISEVDKKKR